MSVNLLEYDVSKKSNREIGTEFINRLNQRYDIRLDRIFENHALTTSEKKKLVTEALLGRMLQQLDAHNQAEGITVNADQDAQFYANLNTDTEQEPNLSIPVHNARIISNYRGADLRNYLYGLTKRFENMSNSKSEGQVAIEIMSAGLLSIGVAMAYETFAARKGGATIVAAIRAGITGIGMKTALTAIAIVLIALLFFFAIENKKQVLGMIINNTDHNMVVDKWEAGVGGGHGSALFMESGTMEGFPVDNSDRFLDSAKVQLKSRIDFGPDDPDNMVFGGFFFAEKKIGFFGAEGLMLFSTMKGPNPRNNKVALLFACPYHADNGIYMTTVADHTDPAAVYDDFYDKRTVSFSGRDAPGWGYLRGAVNDASGGEVALVALISDMAT